MIPAAKITWTVHWWHYFPCLPIGCLFLSNINTHDTNVLTFRFFCIFLTFLMSRGHLKQLTYNLNAQKDKIKSSRINVDGKKYRVKFTGIVLGNSSSNNCISQLSYYASYFSKFQCLNSTPFSFCAYTTLGVSLCIDWSKKIIVKYQWS